MSGKSKVNEKPPTKRPESNLNADIRPKIPSGYKSGKEVSQMIAQNDVKGRNKAEKLVSKTMAGILPPKKSTQVCHELKAEIENERKAKEALR